MVQKSGEKCISEIVKPCEVRNVFYVSMCHDVCVCFGAQVSGTNVEKVYNETVPVNSASELRKRPPSLYASSKGNVMQKAKVEYLCLYNAFLITKLVRVFHLYPGGHEKQIHINPGSFLSPYGLQVTYLESGCG